MSQSQTCHITVTAMRRKVIALGPRLPWNKEELLLELAGKLCVFNLAFCSFLHRQCITQTGLE